MENNIYNIYYDEEGDFLELILGEPPSSEGTDEVESGVFVTKNLDTDEIYSIGILGFKKKYQIFKALLKKLNIDFPLTIGY
jgi:hypothetical protein